MQTHKLNGLFLGLVVLLVVSLAEARRVIRAAPGTNTTGNYIVVLHDNTTHSRYEALVEEIRKESVDSDLYEKVEGSFAKVIAAKITEDSAHKIKLWENVEFVEEESYTTQSVTWALDRLDQESSKLDNTYSPNGNGEGTDVYILDTGINYNHNDFDGRAKYPGYDPVDKADKENRKGQDCDGHGTHVASLSVGSVYGVAKKADVYSVRVLDCSGSAPWSVIIDGLNYAAERITSRNPRRPAVISMSLGGPYSSSVDRTIRNVISRGIPVVAAAGNERDDACKYTPASTTGVITVGGTATGDNIYYYSNGGTCVDVFAPGSNVRAADYRCNTCSVSYSGTSMATPLVSGAVAIYLQKEPNLTPSQIKQKIITDSLKNKLSYSNMKQSLRSSSSNRLLYIKASSASTSISTVTQTVTSTRSLTTTVTSTAVSVSTSTSTITSVSTTTSRVTSTLQVTNIVTSTVPTTSWITTVVPSTVFLTTTFIPTPTPEGVCCETLKNFDELESNMMTNVGSIVNNGIKLIADIVQQNNFTIPPLVEPTPPTDPTAGTTPETAVSACSNLSQSKSGIYWVKVNGNSKQVYCELEKDIKGNKGFLRVANINMSVPGTECPAGLSLRQDGTLKTCQRGQTAPGCTSTYFNSSGMEYSKVCGRVRGYQWASPNAFFHYNKNKLLTINHDYVDGVTLTYRNSNNDRQHIWTFAAALDEVKRTIPLVCQCTNKGSSVNFVTPSFVGEDYFCETGSRQSYQYQTLYRNDPLWDGAGCGEMDTCCQRGQWFCKDVPTTSSDIELRLCGNEGRSNEDTPLEIIELYVK